MSRFRLCAALVVFAAAPALAQQPQPGLPVPRLDTIFPMGAKAGTTVADLGLTGANLDDAESLVFNHPGIKAELVPPPPEPKPDPKDPKKNPPPQEGRHPGPQQVQGDRRRRRAAGQLRRPGRRQGRRQQPADVRRRRPAGSQREGAEQRRARGDEGRPEHDRQRRPSPARRTWIYSWCRRRRGSGSSPRAWPSRSTAGPSRSSRSTTRPAAGWPGTATGRDARRRLRRRRPTATTSSASPSSPTRPAGRTYFYRLTITHGPVDRRRLPAGRRAGQAGPGDALRPQPARRHARADGVRRRPAAGEARRSRSTPPADAATTPDVPRARRAARPAVRTASSTGSRARAASRTPCLIGFATRQGRPGEGAERQARAGDGPAGAVRGRRPDRQARRPRLVRLHRQEGRSRRHRPVGRPARRPTPTSCSPSAPATAEDATMVEKDDNPEILQQHPVLRPHHRPGRRTCSPPRRTAST